MTKPEKQAHFDATMTTVVIEQLTITDKDVVREAQRWTNGERGALIDDPAQLARADLTISLPRPCGSVRTRSP